MHTHKICRAMLIWLVFLALQNSLASEAMSSEFGQNGQDKNLQGDSNSTALPHEVIGKIGELDGTADDYEARGYNDLARHTLLEEIGLCEKYPALDHFIIQSARAHLVWHGWYAALNSDQLSKYKQARDGTERSVGFLNPTDAEHGAIVFKSIVEQRASLGEPPIRSLADDYDSLSLALMYCAKPVPALEAAKQACAIAARSDGESSPIGAQCLSRLGTAYSSLGMPTDAMHVFSKAAKIWVNLGADKNYDEMYVDELLSITATFVGIQDYDRANRCLKEIHRLTDLGRPNSQLLYGMKYYEAAILNEQGQVEDALSKANALIDFSQSAFGAHHTNTLDAYMSKGAVLLAANNIDAATQIINKPYADLSATQQTTRTLIGPSLIYARMLVAQQDFSGAVETLRSAITAFDTQINASDPRLFRFLELYEVALEKVGRKDDAVAAAARSNKIHELIDKSRRRIDSDPACRFSWEEQILIQEK
jgi:tetratricopeptide (TPR) repeat protein